jgi:hypothetical protein
MIVKCGFLIVEVSLQGAALAQAHIKNQQSEIIDHQ